MISRRAWLVIAAALWLLIPGGSPRAAAGADSTAAVHPSATLVIGNREVFVFRASLMGYPPQERVEAARERINDELRSHKRGDLRAPVTVTHSPLGALMQVDGKWMFTVAPADVNPLVGETHAALVERTRRNLEAAVAAVLVQRTPSHLVRSILLSLGATVAFWLLLRGLIRVARWAQRRIENAVRARTERLKLPPTALASQFGVMLRMALRIVALAVGLALTNLWLTFVLKQFPYTYPWGDQLDDYVLDIGTTAGLALLHAIPKLGMLALIYVITRIVVRWVRAVFDAIRAGQFELPGIDAETSIPTQRLVVLGIWLLAIAIAFPYIPGSGGVAFKGLSVLLGIMLSLGSSNVVSQAASGYILIFSKALRVNDYVSVADYEGTVMSMGILSTKIRTPRDEEINVPNSVIVGSITKNYTCLNRETGAPLTITVTIGYNAPWRQIHAMLAEAARRTPGVRKTPEPRVLQTSLSDFYVEYTLLVRLEDPHARVRVKGALNANVQDVFNEYGVQIMSPHYEGDPDGKVWVPKEKWHEAPADSGSKETA